jgi:hypothetical protein
LITKFGIIFRASAMTYIICQCSPFPSHHSSSSDITTETFKTNRYSLIHQKYDVIKTVNCIVSWIYYLLHDCLSVIPFFRNKSLILCSEIGNRSLDGIVIAEQKPFNSSLIRMFTLFAYALLGVASSHGAALIIANGN